MKRTRRELSLLALLTSAALATAGCGGAEAGARPGPDAGSKLDAGATSPDGRDGGGGGTQDGGGGGGGGSRCLFQGHLYGHGLVVAAAAAALGQACALNPEGGEQTVAVRACVRVPLRVGPRLRDRLVAPHALAACVRFEDMGREVSAMRGVIYEAAAWERAVCSRRGRCRLLRCRLRSVCGRGRLENAGRRCRLGSLSKYGWLASDEGRCCCGTFSK